MKVGILVSLIRDDLKARFLGSILGIFWLVISPLLNMAVIFVVFQYGLRIASTGKTDGMWLLVGLVPWYFIVDGLVSVANSITDKPWLVKKIVFDVRLLPLIRTGSAFTIHLALLAALIVTCLLFGKPLDLRVFQLLYYLICGFVMIWSIGVTTSCLCVFAKDISNIIALMTQFAFWLTPVFWNIDTASDFVKKVVLFNPFHYVISGYRNSLLPDGLWFWERPRELLIFWCVIAAIFAFGRVTFKNLRPAFADLL